MQLDWAKYIEVADKYQIKARYEDREDLRQDIILRLAEVASNNGHKPLTELAMYRVASYVVMEYWHSQKRLLTTTSLNEEIEDDEGNTVELYQTIADDKAIDLEAWVDYRTWLKGCPRRLLQIADKTFNHIPLKAKDRKYLERYRRKELAKRQKVLF